MNNSANGKSKPTPPHSHDGHRRRKKEQFLKNGLDGLPEHEPLEFLLYYAIPRGDTNGVAHALIEHFGSLASVVNADYEELLKVKGIGENAASLIYFTRMFSQLYLQKQAITEMSDKSKKSKLYCSDSLKKFCTSLFIGSGEEEIFCVYLTDNLIPLAHEKICTGELGKVRFPIRKTTRSVFKHNCSRLVVTHNHPAGSGIPSRMDIESTNEIRSIYSKMDVELVDHIVVGRDGAVSMRECGYLE